MYLDTSALLKLYRDEVGSELVRDRARGVAAWPRPRSHVEARSALARRRRAGDIAPAEYRAIQRQLDEAWRRFIGLEVTGAVL